MGGSDYRRPGGRSLCARGRISGRGAGAVPFYDRYRDHIFRVKDAADAESARQTTTRGIRYVCSYTYTHSHIHTRTIYNI